MELSAVADSLFCETSLYEEETARKSFSSVFDAPTLRALPVARLKATANSDNPLQQQAFRVQKVVTSQGWPGLGRFLFGTAEAVGGVLLTPFAPAAGQFLIQDGLTNMFGATAENLEKNMEKEKTNKQNEDQKRPEQEKQRERL